MPPFLFLVLCQALRPEVDDGVKQSLWSPASAAVKVKRPSLLPRCETTRWSLSKISYEGFAVSTSWHLSILCFPVMALPAPCCFTDHGRNGERGGGSMA